MTEEESEFLDKELKASFGQGLEALGSMKPLAITSMLTMSLMGEQPASFEMTFIKMAKEQEKEILGLETVAEQMQVFEDIPYESQLDDIIEMLSDKNVTNDYFAKLINSYKEEDLKSINAQMRDYMDDPKEAAILLDDRNKNWIPKVGDLAKDKSTFFGVGAGHLPGENGVIALLKKAGYKVTPVKK